VTPEEILDEMKAAFTRVGEGGRGRKARPRKYVGGLLPALCDFILSLEVSDRRYRSLNEFFRDFPQVTEGVSTLTVRVENEERTIRPAYEKIHKFYIVDSKRRDFPRSGPYATGKWADYRHWLDSIVGFTKEQLEFIVDESKRFVLEQLPESKFDPSSVWADPPVFKLLLEKFEFRAKSQEQTGAAYQAMVFAFLRADAPHLQIEGRKARTGSARVAGVGDVDAWEGDRLIISAEVKHFKMSGKDIDGLEFFIDEVQQRSALGFVIAEDFHEGVRERIYSVGLKPLTKEDILAIVSMWDPLKQRAALNAFQWVIVHKEQSTPLIERFNKFLDSIPKPISIIAEKIVADDQGNEV